MLGSLLRTPQSGGDNSIIFRHAEPYFPTIIKITHNLMAEEPADVIIVGAGLSGLQTALDLHAAGKHVIILEARDRVGGKTYSCSRPDGKGIQELGAAWVNDTNQSHMWEYCKRFQLTPVKQNIVGSVACEDADGECHMFPFGELPKVSYLYF